MQVSSWIMILKAYNWLLLILACQCRPNLILANRFASHRTRLLDTGLKKKFDIIDKY